MWFRKKKEKAEELKAVNPQPDKVQLGDLVRDRITGYTGVVECLSEWLNSCVRVTVRTRELKDGMTQGNNTFDSPQIEVLEIGYFNRHKFDKYQKTGGPEIKPEARVDPV